MSRLSPARRAIPGILGLVLTLATVVVPQPALAADPVTIPQGPLPIGVLQPVEFSFLTIDGTVIPTDSGLALQTETRLRLRNPDKSGASRYVYYPAFASEVKGAREVTETVTLSQTTGVTEITEITVPPGAWVLNLPANGGAVIEAKQSARGDGPVVNLQFDWSSLAPWGAPLSSARLTLHFSGGVDAEQILALDPEPVERDTLRLSWSYEKLQPTGKLQLLMIAPGPWRALRAARVAAAPAEATAADQMALAAALRPLIAAEGMPPERVAALRDELLGALRRAVALDPANARAHRDLALALTERAGGNPALLADAVTELKAAYDLAPHDSELKASLLQAVDALLAACRQKGDSEGLLAALDVAQAVDTQRSVERLAAYADVAVSLLQEDRVQEAEAMIVAGFGQEALDHYAYLRPQFTAVTGEVQTQKGQRVLRFTLRPNPSAVSAAEASVTALVNALKAAGAGEVTHTVSEGQAHVIEISLPFTASAELQPAGQALVSGLPADLEPALAAVAATIGAASVDYQNTQGAWSDHMSYAESVDLSPAQAALDRRLEQLKSARAEADAGTDDPAEAARRRWAALLLQHYDDQWQELTRRSQVSYRLLAAEDVTAPYWVLAWGEKRGLAWTATVRRPERLVPYIAGAGIVVLALVAALMVWRRRRQGPMS